jgi:hypothetical protein
MELNLLLLLPHAFLGRLLKVFLRHNLFVGHHAAARWQFFTLFNQPDKLAVAIINQFN